MTIANIPRTPRKNKQATAESTADLPKKTTTAVAAGRSRLLHVNLPTDLVNAIRTMAKEERRTITAEVRWLLEDSPDLRDFMDLQEPS